MRLLSGQLCVGYVSGFMMFSIQGEMIPLSEYSIILVLILYTYKFSSDINFTNPRFYFHEFFNSSILIFRTKISLKHCLPRNSCNLCPLKPFVVLLYTELVNGDDLTLGFIRVNDLNCLECVELNGGKEFLLCFHSKPLFHLMHT